MREQRRERGRMLRELLPWAPTVAGVFALIALLIIAGTRFASAPEAIAVPPALPAPALPAPALPAPALPAPAASPPALSAPPLSPPAFSSSPLSPPAPSPGRTSRRVRPATVPTSPPPSPGPVSGRYRVVDSYDDAFIGEVLVTNTSGNDRGWQVSLRFPAGVGDLITSGVESAPQATLRRSGPAFVWTSGVPVPAGGRVALRFHFSRTGEGDLPSACTVNGVACGGAR